jgi:acyl-coenzyme A synthetase/AMP-(fatty) acid ligase
VHLRALIESNVSLPPLCGIVSATAPLSQELAAAAEARFGCEVREVFGSTETCVIARRRTASESAWTPLPGVHVHPKPDGTLIHAAHLPVPVTLADLVELESDGRFHLRGRQADLLEIAGKRASLGDLTRRLLAIPGVEDGVMLQLDASNHSGVARIAALVVAPDLDEAAILTALRESVDPVFLPRPLKRVAALPRSETGKLPRAELLKLF